MVLKNGFAFEEFCCGNGLCVVPACKLAFLPSLDTSLDLEIVELGGGLGCLGVLKDFYAAKKTVFALKASGDIIKTNLTVIISQSINSSDTDTQNANKSDTDTRNANKSDTDTQNANDSDNGTQSTNHSDCLRDFVSLFLPAETSVCKERYGFCDLVRIIRRLTAEDGCPWDKVQTHESIAPNMIEEAYEAVSAALAGNTSELLEELGDVLLQPVLNCDIAERGGEFSLADCIDGLCKKLYSRHTHVFGKDKATGEGEALEFWDKAKSKEKSYNGAKERIEKLPTTLPALMRASKTIKAIAKELPLDGQAVIEKIQQTLSEIKKGKPAEETKLLLLICALYTTQKTDTETKLLKETAKLKESFAGAAAGSFLELLEK